MFAVAKKIRALDGGSPDQIPPRAAVDPNTPAWRARVRDEIARRDSERGARGTQAQIVAYVKQRYPRFSSGTLSALLSEEEHPPGQRSHSIYIAPINSFLWPHESPIDEDLLVVLRQMDPEEQRALAEFLSKRHK